MPLQAKYKRDIWELPVRMNHWTNVICIVTLCVTGGVSVLVCVLVSAGLPALLPALFLVVSSVGLVTPNATALALADHPRTAGSASALLGLAQFVFGGLAAPLVGVAGTQSAVPLGVLTAGLSVAAGTAYLLLTRAGPTMSITDEVTAIP